MTHIQYSGSGELHITNITEARTCPKDEFDAVITACQDSIEDNISDSIDYNFYCMSDGPNDSRGDATYELFARAADKLCQLLSSDQTVLIHCHMGQSRSVSVAAAALGRHLDITRSESLEIIYNYRKRINYPSDFLLEHADRYIEGNT